MISQAFWFPWMGETVRAILDGFRGHHAPGLASHEHRLEQIDLVDISLACLVEIECSLTESSFVHCLEATDDSRIEGLNK